MSLHLLLFCHCLVNRSYFYANDDGFSVLSSCRGSVYLFHGGLGISHIILF
ncbi:hypothetical protein KC19_6G163300 [Ceratodon purpureus]|uniref:Uncharacterized protein n=1 Tax=Ceratodon purpureus TaxID=3225 RepID=A0A8T0HFQ5_CERPU|nr:hypothetical protein KC19_6G163300 [Ceratodon purpureus]